MSRQFGTPIGRCFMFCKADKQAQINLEYTSIDFGMGGGFILPLTDSFGLPTDPATHYGANTVVDSQLDSDIKLTGPTLTKYFESDGWTWETALTDMSLQPVVIPV